MNNFEPRATDRADRIDATLVLGLLFVDSVLLAFAETVFASQDVGGTPLPVSAVVALISTPWLVRRAGELATGIRGAILVFLGWFAVVMAAFVGGPGGDVLLPLAWPSIAFILGGLIPGGLALGRVIRHRRDLGRDPSGLRTPVGPGTRSGGGL